MVSHSRKVRFSKTPTGRYVVQGKSYEMLEGSRAQVWHNTAFRTSGGLKKCDLLQNKSGRIVSKSKHHKAKKDNRLVKAGYGTKKGTFGYVLLNGRKGKSKAKGKKSPKRGTRSRKQSGGMMPLNPATYKAMNPATSGDALQMLAGNAGM